MGLTIEAWQAFMDTVREKRKNFLPTSRIGKKRPKNVVMPSDLIDRRKHTNYRSGKVKRYFLHDLVDAVETNETIEGEMAVTNSTATSALNISMKEFRRLSPEKKREILAPLVHEYSDRDIAKLMGSTDKKDAAHIGYVRRHYGIFTKPKGFQPNRSAMLDAITPPSIAPEPESKSTTAPLQGIHLGLSGTYATGDTIRRLKALTAMIETLSLGGTFEVEISLREVPGSRSEVSLDEAVVTASNGVTSAEVSV